jgi:hypothetical protein
MGDVYRWKRSVFAAGLYVLICSLGSIQLLAQTPGNFATISGTVLDPAGMAVPNAGVSVKNEVTGTVHSATTSELDPKNWTGT